MTDVKLISAQQQEQLSSNYKIAREYSGQGLCSIVLLNSSITVSSILKHLLLLTVSLGEGRITVSFVWFLWNCSIFFAGISKVEKVERCALYVMN